MRDGKQCTKHDVPFYVSFPFRDKQELLRCATLHKMYTQQPKMFFRKKAKITEVPYSRLSL